jgi:hypothetical protein
MVKTNCTITIEDEKRITWPIFHKLREMVLSETGYRIVVKDFGGWELVNSQGRIMKRFKANFKKRVGIKLDDDFAAKLGTFIADETADLGMYDVVLDSDCMTNGEFRDGDSCFQEGAFNHHHLLAWNADPLSYTFKIYSQGEPFARALAFVSTSGDVVLTNSYGLPMRVIKRIFTRAFPEYNEVEDIEFNSDIWLNGNAVGFSTEHVNSFAYTNNVFPNDYDRAYDEEDYY